MLVICIAHGKNPLSTLVIFQYDAQEYVALAQRFIQTGQFTTSLPNTPIIPELFRTPGYPAFLVFIFRLFKSPYLIPLVQGVLHALTGVLTFELGRRFFSRTAGITAAILYLLEPAALHGTFFAMSDTLFVALFLGTLLLYFKEIQNTLQRTGRFLLLGVLFACLAYIRGIALFLPFALMGLTLIHTLFQKRRPTFPQLLQQLRGFFLVLCVFCVAIAPWIARNKKVAGFSGFSTLGTYNIFYYNISDYVALKTGVTWENAMRKRLATLDLTPTTLDKNNVEQIHRMSEDVSHFMRSEWLPYGKFHLQKGSIFITQSSIKSEYLFLSKELFDRSVEAPLFPSLFLQGRIKEGLTLVAKYPREWIFLLERGLWVALTLSSLLLLFHKELRYSTPKALSLGLILYFWLLTGPVTITRYRLPAAPLLFLLGIWMLQVIFSFARDRFIRRQKNSLPVSLHS